MKEEAIRDQRIKSVPQGFTLIELLVSFSIILFLILGTAQLILYSMNAKQRSDFSTKSVELASSKLEYLKSIPFDSQELEEGSRRESLRGDSLRGVYLRNWNILDMSSDMKKIEMECYSEQCPQKRTRIALLYSRILGF